MPHQEVLPSLSPPIEAPQSSRRNIALNILFFLPWIFLLISMSLDAEFIKDLVSPFLNNDPVAIHETYFDSTGNQSIQEVTQAPFESFYMTKYKTTSKGALWMRYYFKPHTPNPIFLVVGFKNINFLEMYSTSESNNNIHHETSLNAIETQKPKRIEIPPNGGWIYIKISERINGFINLRFLSIEQLITYVQVRESLFFTLKILSSFSLIFGLIVLFLDRKNTFLRLINASLIFTFLHQKAVFNPFYNLTFIDSNSYLYFIDLIRLGFFILLILIIKFISENKLNIKTYLPDRSIFYFLFFLLISTAHLILPEQENPILYYIFLTSFIFIFFRFFFVLNLKKTLTHNFYTLIILVISLVTTTMITFLQLGLLKFTPKLLIFTFFVLIAVFLINIISITLELQIYLNKKKEELLIFVERVRIEKMHSETQQKFVSMLLHEIKTPLSVIDLAVSNLERQNQELTTVKSSSHELRFTRIFSAIESINTILDKCVQADRFEQPQIALNLSHHVIEDEMNEIIFELSSLDSIDIDRLHLLMVQIESSRLELETDWELLSIIIKNLILNAFKYSQPDTAIVLRILNFTLKQNEHIKFEIINQVGPVGFPNVDKLFERYYRAESSKDIPGSGLGLWISQKLARRLNTEIKVHSNETHITFNFEMPFTFQKAMNLVQTNMNPSPTRLSLGPYLLSSFNTLKTLPTLIKSLYLKRMR